MKTIDQILLHAKNDYEKQHPPITHQKVAVIDDGHKYKLIAVTRHTSGRLVELLVTKIQMRDEELA